jgi:hypothetical protein
MYGLKRFSGKVWKVPVAPTLSSGILLYLQRLYTAYCRYFGAITAIKRTILNRVVGYFVLVVLAAFCAVSTTK